MMPPLVQIVSAEGGGSAINLTLLPQAVVGWPAARGRCVLRCAVGDRPPDAEESSTTHGPRGHTLAKVHTYTPLLPPMHARLTRPGCSKSTSQPPSRPRASTAPAPRSCASRPPRAAGARRDTATRCSRGSGTRCAAGAAAARARAATAAADGGKAAGLARAQPWGTVPWRRRSTCSGSSPEHNYKRQAAVAQHPPTLGPAPTNQ